MAMNGRAPALLVFAVAALLLASFVAMSARVVSSGRAARMVHRDTIVHGDGARLYAHLRSAWFDGDLDTRNELEHYFNYPGSRNPVPIIPTATGYAWNHTPVGCAVLWLPFFLAGHLAARLGGLPADGYSAPYALAVAVGTHVYCLLGVLLLLSLCRRYFAAADALAAVLTVWLASFLPAYLFLYPSMSHVPSFFSVALFIRLWLDARDREGTSRWALLGLAGGVMALVRTQNVIFFCVPLVGLAEKRTREAGRLRGPLAMAGCALLAFLPQMYAWRAAHGAWLTIPQGAGFLHPFRPAVLQVLFSPRHGLFSWTPALLLGAAGIPAFIRRDRLLGASLLLALLMQTYLNAIVDDWWAGTGFGARRFDNCLPLFALGAAASYARVRARAGRAAAAGLAAALIAWNGLFLCQYALNWVSHEEAIDMGRMARDQFRMAATIAGKALDAARGRPRRNP
ncbi:MAG: hypothetical protein PHN82_00395 [bacterium]|nr:hypothetical protein [bacterium]